MENILVIQWKERYAKLSDEIKAKLKWLDEIDWRKIQLKIIKRKRIYPQIGDVFQLNPRGDIFVNGIVVNNHINNQNLEDQILIFIFKIGSDIKACINRGIKREDLLINPLLVYKGYWTGGYFYNIDHIDDEKMASIKNYGFIYDIPGESIVIVDEYGNERMDTELPELLGLFAITTMYGVAYKVNEELIIEGILDVFEEDSSEK